jgi:dTDP-4-dehydrorhamnose reductase
VRGIRHIVAGRSMLDLANPDGIAAALDTIRPWGVVNAAGWVRVDDAEDAEDECQRVNAAGAIALTQACAARGIASLNVSSDLVFDGQATRPYVESDTPCPLNAYGRSKAAMEAGCAELPGALIVRTAAFFSAADPYNFAVAVLDALAAGRPFMAADDQVVTPTFVPALVDRALDLLIDGETGVWHVAGDEAVSWADFARRVAVAAGADASRITGVPGASLGLRAPRPGYAALGSERGPAVGALDRDIAAVVRGFQDRQLQRDVA